MTFSSISFPYLSFLQYEKLDFVTSQSPPTFAPQDNPPCPTIFVANLGPTCSQEELAQVFSRFAINLTSFTLYSVLFLNIIYIIESILFNV